ncbi:ergothioneine biosynthesis protein EgtB [Agaribacterium sp. ZY112]|uniref:ergothioneine biosynthesis protein EgtB n=1 Tax=Agaribacterium sp. ZY112 TaxID=3233574 RepID=UPI003524767D
MQTPTYGAMADLFDQYQQLRSYTQGLCERLSAEDMQVQSMPDASPAKWHLAHTTWFFETFILKKYLANYQVFNPHFAHLFNSYYESAGTRHARPKRGLLTRPSIEQVFAYRAYVDEQMFSCLQQAEANTCDIAEVEMLLQTGLHHEMQHQELLLTDILHLFSCNPMQEAIFASAQLELQAQAPDLGFIDVPAGMHRVGYSGQAFAYDNEGPAHDVYLGSHRLANRLVTNAQWLEFMEDGAYQEPLLWLSDGWATVQKFGWQTPEYWQKQDSIWFQYGLDGLKAIDPNAPVCHISFYEADAFARWSGKRMPHEHELECASLRAIEQGIEPHTGNILQCEYWRPQAAQAGAQGIQQLWGDVWEWTQSSYHAYPHYKAEQGALGEYNGKFMSNQYVLKGGSCVTPQAQLRASYRNFFYPHHRWQFTGLRLAEDA